MRHTAWLLLLSLLLPLVARADGFAFGKSRALHQLNETDQIAVIRCEPGQVTVDMYIAIEGIPPGETVTYILPFWHKAEGFTLEEMDGATFRERCVRPAHARVEAMSRLERGAGSSQISTGLTVGLMGFAGPLILVPAVLFPVFGRSGDGRLEPDTVHRVPLATAEIYSGVRERDLPALLAKAGLPAAQAKTLARYNTEHFAIMRLTGRKAERAEGDAAMGVHYHFRHAVEGSSYTYTYPLGTGAAWPKPILLTEVYAYGPDELVLQGEAPTIGEPLPTTHWRYFSRQIREFRTVPKEDAPNPRSMMTGMSARSSAFHVGYLMSNPSEDIRISVSPRTNLTQLRCAHALGHLAAPWVIGTLLFLLSWLPSLAVARVYWRREDRPQPFGRYWLTRIGVIWTRTALPVGVGLALLLPVPTPTPNPWLILSLGLSGACLLATIILLTRPTIWKGRLSGVWPMWLSAVGTYIVLAIAALIVVRAVESAV